MTLTSLASRQFIFLSVQPEAIIRPGFTKILKIKPLCLSADFSLANYECISGKSSCPVICGAPIDWILISQIFLSGGSVARVLGSQQGCAELEPSLPHPHPEMVSDPS
ncbi:hypothetical protein RRG08_002692 [Elysia crispata]|uniref:Uncharacterized protein n=1 Tax=Elysia crispata TaxID=231223 RepID=A0AAE1CLZ9_9GAST|nr:hypothetical protein RRG08_002692 [Elysia crispata]